MRTNNLLASTALTTSAMLASSAALAQSGPVYNWSGWYGGLNLGGASVDVSHSVTVPGILTSSGSSRDGGVIFGFQMGYNWQFAPQWVLGIEGDINYLRGELGPDSFARTFNPGGGSEDVVGSQRSKLSWLSTIRGRFGYALDRSFIYATGGLAIGRVHSSVTGTGRDSDGGTDSTQFSGSRTSTRTGWTVGAGWEYAFTNRISAKLEYLHFDLGDISYNVTGTITSGDGNGLPLMWPATASFSGDIVRIGVNLKLSP
jgi:outer membrane immunogenic protein